MHVSSQQLPISSGVRLPTHTHQRANPSIWHKACGSTDHMPRRLSGLPHRRHVNCASTLADMCPMRAALRTLPVWTNIPEGAPLAACCCWLLPDHQGDAQEGEGVGVVRVNVPASPSAMRMSAAGGKLQSISGVTWSFTLHCQVPCILHLSGSTGCAQPRHAG
jgi:hypothetical protein